MFDTCKLFRIHPYRNSAMPSSHKKYRYEQLRKSIRNLLATHLPISGKIQHILQLICAIAHDQKCHELGSNASSTCISAFICEYLSIKQLSTVKGFKMLILLHRILIHKIKRFNLNGIMQCLCHFGASNAFKRGNEFEQFLLSSVIQKYVQYLQRKTLQTQIDRMNCYQSPENNPFDQNQSDFTTNDLQSPEMKSECKIMQTYACCYQYINLMNLGLAMNNDITTMSRYFSKQDGCILDFNIAFALDFNHIYEQQIYPRYQLLKQTISSEKQSTNELKQYTKFIDVIQEAHQKLYMIYYNRYNCWTVSKYRPNKWIDTDLQLQNSRQSMINLTKQSIQSNYDVLAKNKLQSSLYEQKSCQIINELSLLVTHFDEKTRIVAQFDVETDQSVDLY